MITDPQQPRLTFAYSCYYCEKDGVSPEQVYHKNDRALYTNETELLKYGLRPQDSKFTCLHIFDVIQANSQYSDYEMVTLFS